MPEATLPDKPPATGEGEQAVVGAVVGGKDEDEANVPSSTTDQMDTEIASEENEQKGALVTQCIHLCAHDEYHGVC